MAAPTVYEGMAKGAETNGQLFAGKTFWVAQRVPMRTEFLNMIKSNGGSVIALEKKADYMIADHHRRDCPPGSISYTFIEDCIKTAQIRNPKFHRAGPPVDASPEGAAASAGPTRRSAPGKRAKFSAEEDRILYKWVRDCEAKGGLADGNEIYKQLEAIHPRHPWSSWRDRYRRQLRDRPPSAFNIPDNAPPSPPTDDPKTESATTATAALAPKEAGVSSLSEEVHTRKHDIMSLADLEKRFSIEDWEQLYAFKEVIETIKGKDYEDAWKGWAEGKAQPAELWQQYYERVVKPQWDRDPDWKHEKVKQRVEKRLQDSQEPVSGNESDENTNTKETVDSTEISTTTLKDKPKREDVDDAGFERFLRDHDKGKVHPTFMIFVRVHKHDVWREQPDLDYNGLHKVLMSKWNALSLEEKARFAVDVDGNASNGEESIDKASQIQPSSSTATEKAPEYVAEAYEKATKSMDQRKRAIKPETGHEQSSPPVKKRKRAHASSSPQQTARQPLTERAVPGGTQLEPLELSSGITSSSPSEIEPNEDTGNHEEGLQNPGSDIFGWDAIVPNSAESREYPSNSPTPRASRVRTANAFNTQAILSSPLSSNSISPLPLPKDLSQNSENNYTDDEEQEDNHEDPESPTLVPFSPTFEPPSDTSTTHSMQEFRRSLDTHSDDNSGYHNRHRPGYDDLEPQQQPPSSPQPLPTRTTTPSPPRNAKPSAEPPTTQNFPLSLPSSPQSTTSSTSTTSSQLDPDPPLTAQEIDDFFTTHHNQGRSDALISAALKRTRCRPSLATLVLDCWTRGEQTPRDKRGIWSEKDDVDVESADAKALKRLEQRHSMSGWGGVMERLRFLAQYRGHR